MAQFDEATVRQRLMADLEQVERDIYARTSGEQAVSPSEGGDGTGVTSEQNDEAAVKAVTGVYQSGLANLKKLAEQKK